MEQVTLKAENRDLLGKKVKVLRGEGKIPAVLYGNKFAPISLTLSQDELLKVLKTASESTLIDLEIPGKEKYKVLLRSVQNEPVSEKVLHVDLYKVDMKQTLQTEIPLNFVGVSPAVEEQEGNFITNKDAIKVECLPDKLVSEIDVDISALKTFEDLIHIKDLKIPEGIEVLDEPEDIIAQVTPPLSEEELKKMEEETAAVTEKAQIENIEAEAQKEKAEKETEAEESTPEETPKSQEGTQESQ